MRYEFWLALRYLFAKRRERFISIIAALSIGGVTIGVGALITIMALMSGFDADIKEKLVGANAHLVVDAPDGIRDVAQVLRTVSALDHVIGASPFISSQAIVRRPGQVFSVQVRGLDAQREIRVNRLGEYIIQGRLPSADDEIVIGSVLAESLGTRRGDRLDLISPSDGKLYQFTVGGIFRSGMYEYDAGLIGMLLAAAQQFYHLEGIVSGIGVKLDDLEKVDQVRRAAQQQLGYAYTVRTWTELYPALFGALRVEKTAMFFVLVLIIVVAALNIMSMLIMIVMEKTKDIGILRALGATRASVARVFLFQGATIGLVGIGLGFGLGFALTLNLNRIAKWLEQTFGISLFPQSVYYLDHIPTKISSGDLVGIMTAAFLLAVLASAYAAVRAARLVPAQALRYE